MNATLLIGENSSTAWRFWLVLIVFPLLFKMTLRNWFDPNWRHELTNALITTSVIAVVGLIGTGIYSFMTKGPPPLYVFLGGGAVIGLLLGGALYLIVTKGSTTGEASSAIPVYPPFKSASEQNKTELGEAIAPEFDAINVQQNAHEKALVLWIHAINTIYKLPSDTKEDWQAVEDYAWSSHAAYSGPKLRELFPQCPPEKEPPWAGVAYHWLQNPKDWEWIGWRRWILAYTEGECFIQTFEKGFIIGPLRLGNDDRKNAHVLVIFKNGKRRSISDKNMTAGGHEIPKDKL